MTATSAIPLSRPQSRRGFTLTEIAMVLSVMGIILGGIWAVAGAVYDNNHIKTATQQFMTISANWKSAFSSRRVDIADNTNITTMSINNNFLPADMITSPTTAVNPWNGGVNILSSQTDNGIIISYSGLNQSACVRLANALSNTSIIWQEINTNSQYTPGSITGGGNTLWSLSTIAGYCNGDSNSVSVMYPM
jgi:prepilin-type N-terminal cleavage/methylation domain-containing protein